MERRIRVTAVLGVAAVLTFAVAAYAFLWALSSYNLAFADCHGKFSLDASNIRCQRPILLAQAFKFFAVSGVVLSALAVLAFVFRRLRGASA